MGFLNRKELTGVVKVSLGVVRESDLANKAFSA